MVVVKKLELDVLKPHKPSILELSKALSKLKGVDNCDINIIEIERDVETVIVQLQGSDINIGEIRKIIRDNGATIHNIDKVTTGKNAK
tara:strand:- start:1668 stop:1931 length:264 start_codon:yes stop_codon:yes gene_type:complete